jgi:hypothetical protein
MQAGTVAELMHMLARAERAQDPGPGASAY